MSRFEMQIQTYLTFKSKANPKTFRPVFLVLQQPAALIS